MPTFAEKLFKFILDDKEALQKILMELPPEQRSAVIGRKGRIFISGPDGGTFIIRLTPVGIFEEDNDEDIRNEISMKDDTLIEIVVYFANNSGNPGLSPRAARSHGMIKITGDRWLYDSDEIFSALEKQAFSRIKVVAKEMLADTGRD